MCLCKGGGLGLTVIVDHADITDDELVGIASYCCFNIVHMGREHASREKKCLW